MSLTNRALFIIERNLSEPLTLDDIASGCGVSRFHLAHAFGEAAGLSVMDYVRGRRLSEAARQLALGASDILGLALASQYASHQAFSRAFKTRFGRTPEAVRKSGSTLGLALVQPLSPVEGSALSLKPPVFQKVGPLLFVGQKTHVPYGELQRIAVQWASFMTGPYQDISQKRDEPPVGLTTGSDEDGFDYVCAAEVVGAGPVPKGCETVRLEPATYAVFSHDAHVTELRKTYDAIWNEWFPASAFQPAEAPGLERHNPTFDPRTGAGGVTIWLPVEPRSDSSASG